MKDADIFLEKVTVEELRSAWPQNEEGKLCSRLLQRYVFSLLVESAADATCTLEAAASESGANKAFARMVRDFALLRSEATPKKERTALAPLHRFNNPDSQPNTK